MSNYSKILNWDSDFFSLKVASINVESLDEDYLNEELKSYKDNDYDLVYVFLNGDSVLPDSINDLYNSLFVDCKLVYRINLEDRPVCGSSDVSDFRGVPSELYGLALEAGRESRFHMDPNFKKGEFERLYRTWIDNSLLQGFADKTIVYKTEEGILGFITLKVKDDYVSIGLIATDSNYRNKGIGQILMSFAKQYTWDSGQYFLKVETQKSNKAACAFYEKNGMSIESQTNIYHIWLKQK